MDEVEPVVAHMLPSNASDDDISLASAGAENKAVLFGQIHCDAEITDPYRLDK
jgi:hypothetical protein